MKTQSKRKKFLWLIIAVFVIIFTSIYEMLNSIPTDIKIATGRESGGYYGFARQYQDLLADQIHTVLIPTAGSMAVLEKLRKGEVEFGLVQGGVADKDKYAKLKSMGSLFYEPIWFFHRKTEDIVYLSDLKGRKIAIGENGSGTQPVAIQLLKDNNVSERNADLLKFSSEKAAQELVDGKIDGAFFVMSLNSKLIYDLLFNQDIELMDFERSIAYISRYAHFTTIELGKGMIDLEHNIPSKPKTLLGTTATLVGKANLDPNIIYMMLKTITTVHSAGGLFERYEQFPSQKFVDLPIHEDALYFFEHGPTWVQRFLPIWIVQHAMVIISFIALFSFFRFIFPIYGWLMRSKIFEWYPKIFQIDKDFEGNEKIENLRKLEADILQSISVPHAFMADLCSLRAHLNMMIEVELKKLEGNGACSLVGTT